MTTEQQRRSPVDPVVERYDRRTRWWHAFVYSVVLILLGTGIWLFTGNEGAPSPLARLTNESDVSIHTWLGYALIGALVVGLTIGWRGVCTFILESLRFRRSDAGWFVRWPRAALTGDFAHHEGHFDPGQRIANVIMVWALVGLVVSGAGLALVHGGPAFVWFVRVHKWSTFVLVPAVAGHILLASGLLPGYRGVWRSMHLGGRLDRKVAARLWPGWLERRR